MARILCCGTRRARCVAAPLELLDVDAGVEAAPVGSQDDDADRGVGAERMKLGCELVPTSGIERVDRWGGDYDLRDTGLDRAGDTHGPSTLGVEHVLL